MCPNAPDSRSQSWRSAPQKRRTSKAARYVGLIVTGIVGIVLIGVFFVWVKPDPRSIVRFVYLHADYPADGEYHVAQFPNVPHEASRWDKEGKDTAKARYTINGGEFALNSFAPTQLVQQLGNQNEVFDSLVVYVRAQGVSRDNKAYFLTNQFNSSLRPPKQQHNSMLSAEELLKAIRDSGAQSKLLILDAGDIESDVWSGTLVNEFANLLEQEVKSTQDDHLWVLCSHGTQQRSHVSDRLGKSVFAHYVSRGLSGEAFAPTPNEAEAAEGNQKVEVDLNELYTFVRRNVQGWVEATGASLQTPLLIYGGDDEELEEQAQLFIVPNVPWDDAKRPKEVGSTETARELSGNHPVKVRQRWLSPRSSSGILAVDQRSNLPARFTHSAPVYIAQASTDRETSDTNSANGPETKPAEEPESEAKSADAPSSADNQPKDSESATAGKLQDGTSANEAAEPEEANATKRPSDEQSSGEESLRDDTLAELLKTAWELRDQLDNRDESILGSPVDYAPHSWRAFQERLLGYERILRCGREAPRVTEILREKIIPLLEGLVAGKIAEDPVLLPTLNHLAESVPAFDPKPDFRETVPRSLAVAELLPWGNQYNDVEEEARAVYQLWDHADSDGDPATDSDSKDIDANAMPIGLPNLLERRMNDWIDAAQTERDEAVLRELLEVRIEGERAAAFAYWCTPIVQSEVEKGDVAFLLALRGNPAKMDGRMALAREHYAKAHSVADEVNRAVQLRNSVTFRAPYYVRLHDRCMSVDYKLPQLETVTILLAQLADLCQALKKWDQTDTSWLEELRKKHDALADTNDRLNRELSAKIADLKQSNDARDCGLIDALLSSPLLTATDRTALLDAIEQREPTTIEPVVSDPVLYDRPPVNWKVVKERALLEASLLRLAGQEVPDTADLNETKDDASDYRRLGAKLAAGYDAIQKQLLQSTDGGGLDSNDERKPNQFVIAERATQEQELRLLDARDATQDDGVTPIINPIIRTRQLGLAQLLTWHRQRFVDAVDGASADEAAFLIDSANAYSRLTSQMPNGFATNRQNEVRPIDQLLSVQTRSEIDLTDEEKDTFRVSLRSHGQKNMSVWLVARYNPDLIKVSVDGENVRDIYHSHWDERFDEKPASFVLPPGENRDFNVDVSRTARRMGDTRLTLKFYSQHASPNVDRDTDEKVMVYLPAIVNVRLPSPDIARLAVMEQDETSNEVSTDILWQYDRQKDHTLLLRPFPNTATPYRLGLINQDGKARSVRVELRNENGQPLAQCTMPLEGSKTPQPIPFAPPEKKADPANGDASADSPADAPAASPDDSAPDEGALAGTRSDWLICTISELAPVATASGSEADPGEPSIIATTKWKLEIRPLRPSDYLDAGVRYDATEDRIRVTVTAKDVLPADGSTVLWDDGDALPIRNVRPIGEGIVDKKEAVLTVDLPAVELSADASELSHDVPISLTVDNYRRAFVFRIDGSNVKQFKSLPPQVLFFPPPTEEEAEQPAEIKPQRAIAMKPQDSVTIQLRVNVEGEKVSENPDDPAIVGIDWDNDGTLNADELSKSKTFWVDRQRAASVEIDKGKGINVHTKIEFLNFELNIRGEQNKTGQCLVFRDEQPWDQIEHQTGQARPSKITIDDSLPVVEQLDAVPARPIEGTQFAVTAKTSDGDTEVESLALYLVPENDWLKNKGTWKGQNGIPEGTPNVASIPGSRQTDRSRWEALIPAETVGSFVLAVQATDEVGNKSELSELNTLSIRIMPEPPPPKTVNSIRVQVTYSTQNRRIGGALVKLYQGETEVTAATADKDGVCVFKDLQPGKYRVGAQGRPTGSKFIRGLADVTLLAPPNPPASVTVDLDEFGALPSMP